MYTNAGMHAPRTPVTPLLLLLSLCAMAGLLLSPASAAAATDDGDRWVLDNSPSEPPRAAVAGGAPGGGTEYDADADADAADEVAVPVAVAVAPAAQRFMPHQPSALSPEAKRELEHEARCGPRVPVRPGFPWRPSCLGGDGEPSGAPVRHDGSQEQRP